MSEPADIPIYLLSREARRSVKMILTGEGSDELLGGYPKHSVERFTPVYQILPGWVRHDLVEPLIGALPFRFRRVKTAMNRPKVGFRVPVDKWFQGHMRNYLCDHLMGPDCRTRDLDRAEAVRRVVTEHVEGRRNHEKLLWAMLNPEIWYRE